MELTDRQRRLVFVALVVALAALGVFLTVGGGSHGDAGAARPSVTPTTETAAPPPATIPPATGPPPSYDIYSFLPFSRQDFNAAADGARRFTAAYGTYRFDEDPKTYIGRLRGMVTGELAGQ